MKILLNDQINSFQAKTIVVLINYKTNKENWGYVQALHHILSAT